MNVPSLVQASRAVGRLAAATLLAGALSFHAGAARGDDGREPAPPVCQEAIIDPSTGAPECVNPPGAPVEPLPPPTQAQCLMYQDLHLEACRRFESGHPAPTKPAKPRIPKRSA